MGSYNELVEIWGNIISPKSERAPTDISIYLNQLQDFFHVGPFYFYVFDTTNTTFEYISENMQSLLGYDPKVLTVAEFIDKIHPEDLNFFIQCENSTVEFIKTITPQQLLNYKISYDYRVRMANGGFIRILQQVVTIDMDLETGMIFKTLGVHTDISHIKSVDFGTEHSILSFIGMKGEKSYIKKIDKNLVIKDDLSQLFTERQKQIIACLMNGMNSKEIAEKLFISRHTVDTHRRSILQILDVTNTHKMILLLSKTGWI
jgi:DNA-binding CsgD family transcriptional regulator